MATEILGVAVCDECESRIRILSKHKHLLGKAVRCPKCHSSFRLELEEATPNELIAIESEQESENKTKKRTRRTRSQIRQEHVDTCMDGFRALHSRLMAIKEEGKSSEEQIRVWVIDALRTALGYDDSELDTEIKALGKRVDIAIKQNDEVKVVVECKNIRSRLRTPVREQAGNYAVTLSAPWAVVTNGDIWKLYRVTPVKGREPRMDLVFDLALLDEDGISEADAEHLYLLCSRAFKAGDTEKEYHEVICTSAPRLYEAFFSERVIAAVRKELLGSYADDTGQKLKIEDEMVRAAIHDVLTPLEL